MYDDGPTLPSRGGEGKQASVLVRGGGACVSAFQRAGSALRRPTLFYPTWATKKHVALGSLTRCLSVLSTIAGQYGKLGDQVGDDTEDMA